MDQFLLRMLLLTQQEFFKINLRMFVNFDEPVEAPIKEVSTEPEFNKNLIKKS